MSTMHDQTPFPSDGGDETVSKEQVAEWVRIINDKTLPEQVRREAKNAMVMAQKTFIGKRVWRWTAGSIGLDTIHDLQNSAYAMLLDSASNIAGQADDVSSLLSAIALRIKTWAADKIRHKNRVKRGGGREREHLEFDNQTDDSLAAPDEEAAHREFLELLGVSVNEAISQLDDLESSVILSFFGIDGPKLSLREIADLRQRTFVDVDNAKRRAIEKLRKWLKDANDGFNNDHA